MNNVLKKKRAEALTAALEAKGVGQVELARQMTDTEREAQNLRKRLSTAVNQRNLLQLELCFAIEKHLSLPDGTLVCQVDDSEQSKFEELCHKYGISEADAVAIGSSRDPVCVSRGMALRSAMVAAGVSKDQLSAMLKQAGNPLAASSIGNMMLGWNKLSDSWAVAMGPMLGVSPSVLLATDKLHSQPSSQPERESEPPSVALEQVESGDTRVSLQDLGLELGEFRFVDGRFVGPEGYSLVRKGHYYVLEISIEERIPFDRIANLVLR